MPLWVAAGAAIYGLSTWRHQLKGQRQLHHAEEALAAGREAFGRVRAVRSRLSQIPAEEADDKTKRRAALLALVNTRFGAAWESWRLFQRHYILTNFFAEPDPFRRDVATSLADCLYELQNHAEMVFTDWGDDEDLAHREEIIKERKLFYGVTTPAGGKDPLEERLKAAEAALEGQLGPILNAQGVWARFPWPRGKVRSLPQNGA